MAEPFIGEIRIWALNFAPRNWAYCDGALLPIASYTALFSILGTTYGGDGRTTFGLPDLRGRVPVHPGNGPGLTPRSLGARFGTTSETLTVAQVPSHGHSLAGSTDAATSSTPDGRVLAAASVNVYGTDATGTMPAAAIPAAGGSGAHNNLQPYLTMTFCIALLGLYPSRT